MRISMSRHAVADRPKHRDKAYAAFAEVVDGSE